MLRRGIAQLFFSLEYSIPLNNLLKPILKLLIFICVSAKLHKLNTVIKYIKSIKKPCQWLPIDNSENNRSHFNKYR